MYSGRRFNTFDKLMVICENKDFEIQILLEFYDANFDNYEEQVSDRVKDSIL